MTTISLVGVQRPFLRLLYCSQSHYPQNGQNMKWWQTSPGVKVNLCLPTIRKTRWNLNSCKSAISKTTAGQKEFKLTWPHSQKRKNNNNNNLLEHKKLWKVLEGALPSMSDIELKQDSAKWHHTCRIHRSCCGVTSNMPFMFENPPKELNWLSLNFNSSILIKKKPFCIYCDYVCEIFKFVWSSETFNFDKKKRKKKSVRRQTLFEPPNWLVGRV